MSQIIAMQRHFRGPVWTYLMFVWNLSWKTFAVAMLSAVLVGVILGTLSNFYGWPPHGLSVVAAIVGLPITLAVMGWVMILQVRDLGRKLN